MTIIFKDFLIADRTTGLMMLDVSRLEELSSAEFRRVYIAEMKKFVKHHGKKPICSRCSVDIERPNNLVRYFEENLHYKCFRETYGEERYSLGERERGYFDLVSLMIDNVPTKI